MTHALGLIRIGDRNLRRSEFGDHDPVGAQRLLSEAYEKRLIIACLCQGEDKPIAMHVAHRDKVYVLKRNPGSGPLHHVDCDSAGAAVTALNSRFGAGAAAETTEGAVVLHLSQQLSESGPAGVVRDPRSPSLMGVSTSQRKPEISQVAFLRFLWEQAELNRWHPGMENKRTWGVVRHHLARVLRETWLGRTLAQTAVFVPRAFKYEGQGGRDAAFLRSAQAIQVQYESMLERLGADKTPILQVIAPLSKIRADAEGKYLVVNHMPSVKFRDNGSVMERFENIAAKALLRLANPENTARLLLLLSVIRDDDGEFRIRNIAMTEANRHYLPYANATEAALLDKLIREKRTFRLTPSLDGKPQTKFGNLLDDARQTPIYVGALGDGKDVPDGAYAWDTEVQLEPPALPFGRELKRA